MNRERMSAILEAYGAAPARWPESERAAAQAWAAVNTAEFAAMARAAAALDAALSLDMRTGGDEAALMARILASAPRGGGDGNIVRPAFGRPAAPRSFWREATALAACAALGLAIGFANGRADDDGGYEMDAAFGAAFQSLGADFVDGAGG